MWGAALVDIDARLGAVRQQRPSRARVVEVDVCEDDVTDLSGLDPGGAYGGQQLFQVRGRADVHQRCALRTSQQIAGDNSRHALIKSVQQPQIIGEPPSRLSVHAWILYIGCG